MIKNKKILVIGSSNTDMTILTETARGIPAPTKEPAAIDSPLD